MDDFYSDMAEFVREITLPTSQDGLGQGKLELVRETPGVPDPNKPFLPVPPKLETHPMQGAVFGVSSYIIGTEVGGTIIVGSDLEATCAVPEVMPRFGDTLRIDGRPVKVLRCEPIPAAGTPSAVSLILRG